MGVTKKRNPMKPLILITITVFVLISLIVVLDNKQNNGSADKVLASHPPIENQPTLGDSNAPVSVVEFGDYKCPACREWSEYIFPQLKKDYIDTGKISFSYINVLFHGAESYLGSLAGEAIWYQEPDAFWAFNKALYKEQPPRQSHDDYWITLEKIMEIAKGTVPHIDLNQLEQDIINNRFEENVRLDDQLVNEYQVKLTPSIVINGTMVEDPFNYENIKQLIEKGIK